MAFRSFSVRLLVFLAIFGVGLVILMSGIHVRPFGFADAFDAVRVIAGGAIMGAALIFELVLEHRAPPADEGRTVARRTRKAAERGDPDAQFNLGVLYDNGRFVPRDYAEAVKWYRKASDKGVVAAQFNLALMYREGHGVDRNDSEAVKWYRKAAENGSAAAQFNLSLMYDKGDGIEQDYDAAAKWCRLAAEQGHRDAQYNLGQMYRHGQGVPRDMDEAVNWLRKASA